MKQVNSLCKWMTHCLIIGTMIFYAAPSQAQCNDAYEPNNTFGKAKLIGSNIEIHALINPAADKDYYKVHVTPEENNLRIILSSMPENYNMNLYDKQQQKVAGAKHQGLENDTIVYNNGVAGTYFIKVFQKNDLFNASDCYNLSTDISSSPFKLSSSNEASGSIELKIFPNPANQFLTVQFDEELSGDVVVSIFDLEGREVMKTTLSSESNSQQIDISSLNSGMYVMKAVVENQVVMQKFSVAR